MTYLKNHRVLVQGIDAQDQLARVIRQLSPARYSVKLDGGTTLPVGVNHLRYIGRKISANETQN